MCSPAHTHIVSVTCMHVESTPPLKVKCEIIASLIRLSRRTVDCAPRFTGESVLNIGGSSGPSSKQCALFDSAPATVRLLKMRQYRAPEVAWALCCHPTPARCRTVTQRSDFMNVRGSTIFPSRCTSKCTWVPVERPVDPIKAIGCPCLTVSPR